MGQKPKGHSSIKGTVRGIHQSLPNYKFVFKTDVKSYYASIDHIFVMDQLAETIDDRIILNLIRQYMRHLFERD